MMTATDIETEDVLRALSVRDHDDDRPGPGGWTRRKFLQAIGAGVIGGAVVGSLGESVIPGDLRQAFAAPPIGATDGILLTVVLYGGNDGLNTVVPYGNGLYYSQRGSLAIPANTVLPLDAQFGLHPRLPYLKSLWDKQQLAIVRGVGYPNPDLSHFTSMEIWMNARYPSGSRTSGWIGRWLDGLSADKADLAVATLDTSVPLHMQGDVRRAVAISPYGDMFATGTSASDRRMYSGLTALAASSGGRGTWHDQFAATVRNQVTTAQQVAPVFAKTLPDAELVGKMTIAARLVNANVGLRVIDMGLGGFDTHDNQAASHPDLLGQVNDAIAAFYATVSPDFRDRVSILVLSEFGRMPYGNGSGGTDHGTANDLFVIGTKVKGGFFGTAPSLNVRDRWSRTTYTMDFRSLLGSVIDGWLGGGASTILGGASENLGLFTATPSAPPPAPGPVTPTPGPGTPFVVAPPATQTGFVPATPVRVFDTRTGLGGRSTPLGAGQTWRFTLAGVGGVPADAVAVALNVTAVGATESTWLSIYPAAQARPNASNLNPMPGPAVPNLVIAPLGAGGALDIYNDKGTVQLIGDVVGWFTASCATGMRPLAPARLLDTRVGEGGVAGMIGPGQTVEVQVAGRGGVPADAQAVSINVTAVSATEVSYLTVFPSGEGRPNASSVNMANADAVPNMVFARLGTGGKISVFNASGSTHVIIDVLSSFGPGNSSRFVAVSPSRVLDTRTGTGAPAAPLGAGVLHLPLAGRGSVPPSGATAVLLNVTAITPSTSTYLTVFPSDVAQPNASNLNASAGQVVPNMVIARLGADGAARIFNASGSVHVVGDVMGYFVG